MEYWLEKVREAQAIIEEFNGSDYYISDYGPTETQYWYHIPCMMMKEVQEEKVIVDNVLDIGPGYGTLSVFANRTYRCNSYATDIIDNLGILKETIPIHYAENNIETQEIPFNVKFDRIIFTEVLEHLRCCPVKVLNKLRQSLSNEGVIYLSTPDACTWGFNYEFYNHMWQMPMDCDYVTEDPIEDDKHRYHYTLSELLFLFEKAKLRVHCYHKSKGEWGDHWNFKLSI